MTSAGPVDWREARFLAAGAARVLAVEQVTLADAAGRRLAHDLVARIDIPHYASSAMDGWAVAGPPPWTVSATRQLASGECTPVVTGAEIPAGATAVLRSEHAVRPDPATVSLADGAPAPSADAHIRSIGAEAVRGEVLARAGALLTPAHVALAASAGDDSLAVVRRPRVAFVLTGDEVVESGVPRAGRVRDSFGPVLPAIVEGIGGRCVSSVRVADSRVELAAAILDSARSADVVVTTGGTSRSDADHLRPVLAELGAVPVVDGIRMRPGGPSILSRLPDGALVVGLPGNPLAALLAVPVLLVPLLAAFGGAAPPRDRGVVAGAAVEGRPGTTVLVPYRDDGDGAVPVAHRGSAMVRGLAEADGILVCPPEGLAVGDVATSLDLPWWRRAD